MHIVHVTEAWNGGVATYLNTLLRQQVLQKDITGITLFYDPARATRDFDTAFYAAHGIALIPYESSRHPKQFLAIAKALNTQISGLSPQSGSSSVIVHLHSTFPGVYGRLLKGAWKSVYCAHGWSFVQESGGFKRFVYRAVERFLARRCDGIINISQHEQDEAERAGIKPPIMEAILSGVEDINPATQADFAPSQDGLNFGFIGRLDYKKGFDILARVFAAPEMAAHQLYVIGAANRDGHGSEIPEAANIHYLGWIDHRALGGYIGALDAVIVPSRQEGFGLTAVEAMRSGIPAIVSNRGGLPELIENGRDGFVFDLEDAASALPALIGGLSRETLRGAGADARKSYERRFMATRFGDDILGFYKRLAV